MEICNSSLKASHTRQAQKDIILREVWIDRIEGERKDKHGKRRKNKKAKNETTKKTKTRINERKYTGKDEQTKSNAVEGKVTKDEQLKRRTDEKTSR